MLCEKEVLIDTEYIAYIYIEMQLVRKIIHFIKKVFQIILKIFENISTYCHKY